MKSKYEVKSCKNANSMNSYKSMDKFEPVSMFLIPPEPRSSINRSAKASKNEEKSLLSQTVHCASAAEDPNLRKSNC